MHQPTGSTDIALARFGWWHVLVALVVGAITYLAFSRTIFADFVGWDDNINVYENPRIKGLTWENLRWMFSDLDQALRYKPLSWFTWALIYQIGGLNPLFYHLANVVLHSINAALVFVAIHALFSANRKTAQPPSVYLLICCALGAIAWAIHPLRVEPVAWVTGLPYEQALFFMLLSLLCYLRGRDPMTAGNASRIFRYLSIGAFGLALLTYPIVIGFVGVLVAIDLFLFKPTYSDDGRFNSALGKVLVDKLPYVAAAIICVGINFYGRLQTSALYDQAGSHAPTLQEFGLFDRVMQAFYVWAYYIWRHLWPADLAPMYTRLVEFHPAEAIFIASALFVVGLTALAWFKRKSCPEGAALWFSYLVLLVPVLGVTEHPHFASDRYSIVAGIVWSVALTGLLLRLEPWKWKARVGASAAVAAGLLLGAMTWRQTPVWADSEALFKHSIKIVGESRHAAPFHYRLGYVYIRQQKQRAAAEHLEQAIRLEPGLVGAYRLLGDCWAELGDKNRAIVTYRRGLELSADDAVLRYKLALLLAQTGQAEEASVEYERLLQIHRNRIPESLHAMYRDALAAAKSGTSRH